MEQFFTADSPSSQIEIYRNTYIEGLILVKNKKREVVVVSHKNEGGK